MYTTSPIKINEIPLLCLSVIYLVIQWRWYSRYWGLNGFHFPISSLVPLSGLWDLSSMSRTYTMNEHFFFFNKVFFSWFVFVFLVWEWNVVIMLTIEKYFVFEYWWCLWPVKSCWIHLQVGPTQLSLFCGTYGNMWYM